ncbi:PIN domain-containing protein [Exiguobacterium sp.]|uniref:PIN domain-containing protein n=1 Tax=Exiguobacterium sp. TaxID=44751 RepID=UPI0028AD6610|nr:PIN domain-containing protein [Exiguobacterium sp.]
MIVYIDSNIMFKDPYLNSNMMTSIWDVIRATNGKLIIPSVVKKEALNNLVKKNNEHKNELENNIRLFSSTMLDKSSLNSLTIPDISEEDFKKSYLLQIDNLISSGLVKIADHKSMDQEKLVDDLLHRALYSIKPFKEGKEEFKDAMIWNTIIHDIQINDYKNCIFITANVKDFYSTDKCSLHKELINDVPKGFSIQPYKSIKEFVDSQEFQTELEAIKLSSKEDKTLEEKNISQIAKKIDEEYLLKKLQHTYAYYVSQSLGDHSYNLAYNSPEYYVLYFPLLFSRMHYFKKYEANFAREIVVDILNINDFTVTPKDNYILVVCDMEIVPKVLEDIEDYPDTMEFAALKAKISFTIDENENFEQFEMTFISPLRASLDLF